MSAHRERIVAAALELITTSGWSSVTMGRVAGMAGVSRQTVYNEVGGKPQLAEAVVAAELARFLALVQGAFAAAPGEPVEGIRLAVRRVLEEARRTPVIRAVVAGSTGTDADLLPLLTSRSDLLLAQASEVVSAELAGAGVPLAGEPLQALVDAVVRVTLSHVVRPGGSPRRTADGIAGLAGAVLGAPAGGAGT